MSPKNKFWWFVAVSVLITFILFALLAGFFWRQLQPQEKDLLIGILKNNFALLFIALFLALTTIIFALDGIFHNYIIPVSRLAEETRIIHSVNPSHRIKIEGSADIVRLARIINDHADSLETARETVKEQVLKAKSEAEEEKNLLASFMGELPEGVLICNTDGRILFYNKQARRFLEQNQEASEEIMYSGRFIGLGRSIFGIIDKNLLVHALDEISEKLKREETNAAAYFVIAGREGRLMRVEAVPILNAGRDYVGFILIFHEITHQIESERRVDFLLQGLLRRFRSSVAGIRSAVEAILEYPHMAAEQRDNFQRIIHTEAVNLARLLDRTAAEYSGHVRTNWPLVHMPVEELFATVKGKVEERTDIRLDLEMPRGACPVKVDSYSIIQGMAFILERLRKEAGVDRFHCTFGKEDPFVHVDIHWEGRPVKIDTLRKWEMLPLVRESEGIGLTLKEVLEHHNAQLWCHACKGSGNGSSVRLFLPAVDDPGPENENGGAILQESRPEYFDFDLFNQPGQNPEVDGRPLTGITFTVFDTETTGLNPKTDEIISIGAVRIVNGRLLYKECFDQLIDPRRPLPYESVKVHGIGEEMLAGQPTIDKVLPMFRRFAEETVLVGHNAAFDLRMFQMKEAQTGVHMINPILDTLLLSAVVHPAQSDHNLEAICERLGIRIMGRHTALGDAIATGEVFLRLLPLLAKEGITTLRDARVASKKSYYARLKY